MGVSWAWTGELLPAQVYVKRIEGFKEEAGFMDKTDPFVEITLGNETYKTKTLDNAGGSGVFNEKLSFNKQSSENKLLVKVFDSDTLSNDLLGEREIDLNLQDFHDGNDEIPFDMIKKGTVRGKIFMDFEACV